MSFFDELKRRNVIRVVIAYVIVAWLSLQIADVILNNITAPEWIFKALMLFLAVGLPFAIIFAWAFELTPEGLKREREIDRSQSITRNTGRKLDFLIIAVLVIAVGMLLVDKFITTDEPEPAATVVDDAADAGNIAPSIAVLPFVNMSADENSAYFSDGLADTVLHMLAQVRELRVAARTSSFQFRDQSMDVAEIGRQLNVSAILEGSVQRSGDKIRVTAQLIDVSNGFHLWSGNFDRDLENVFAIQDEIALEVVAALKVSLLGETVAQLNAGRTDDVDAYSEYLLGVNELNKLNSESLPNAVGHLQEAIRLDENFALAYAILGRTYLSMADFGSMRQTQAVEAARNMAGRALDISPDLTEALAVLGFAELSDRNMEAAGQLLTRALEKGPNNSVTLYYYGLFLIRDARPVEAIAIYEQIVRLDPLAEAPYIVLAGLLSGQRRFSESAEVLTRVRRINSQNANAIWLESRLEFVQGNWAASIPLQREAIDADPDDVEGPAMLARAYLNLDMPMEAARYFDSAVEIEAEHPMSLAAPLWLNYYYQRNDSENFALARELLEDGIENRRNSRDIALIVLIEHAIKTNEFDITLGVLDNLYPQLFDDPPHGLDQDTGAAFYAGWALLQSGETERGSVLLRSFVDQSKRFEEAYSMSWRSIASELMLGNDDAAIDKLALVNEDKYRMGSFRALIEHSSLFAPLRDEPAFTALVDEYREHAKEQRLILQAAN
jgi:TolB-like protein/cytochrome c-type biogenesis protein CcmH/NrfG